MEFETTDINFRNLDNPVETFSDILDSEILLTYKQYLETEYYFMVYLDRVYLLSIDNMVTTDDNLYTFRLSSDTTLEFFKHESS